MNRRAGWLVGAVVAALGGVLAIFLHMKAVPYQEVIEHGPAPEAQANPYLAAEHYLRQQGIKVEHANSLDVLPTLEPRQRTLLLLGERSNMTPRSVDQVMNWTRAARPTAVCRRSLVGRQHKQQR